MNKPPKNKNQKQTSDQSVSLPSLLLFSFLFHFPSGGNLCLVSRKTVQSPAGSHSRTVAYMALHVVLNTHFSASGFFLLYLFVCLFYTSTFTQQTNIKSTSLWSQTEVHRSNHMHSERVSIPFSLLPFAEPQLSEIAF